MHALSGYDTVPKISGIGKVTALKIATQNLLSFLSNQQSTTSDFWGKMLWFQKLYKYVRNEVRLILKMF